MMRGDKASNALNALPPNPSQVEERKIAGFDKETRPSRGGSYGHEQKELQSQKGMFLASCLPISVLVAVRSSGAASACHH